MKLTYLRVINYKQYYHEQSASFSTDDQLNVTVFHGKNGAGKTSLFNAVNWCLYGEGIAGTGELLNKQALDEAREGDRLPVVATIIFQDHGIEYIAERVKYFTKQNGQAVLNKDEFTLSKTDRLGQTTKIPNPVGIMDSILPVNVRQYFFFDGEKMVDLTSPGNSNIEDAIKNIMRLPIIDKAVRHLSEITKDYRGEIQKIGTDRVDDLIERQSRLEKDIEELKEEIKKYETEINKGNRQLEEIDAGLLESREVGNLQKQRDEIEKQLRLLDSNRKEQENSIVKLVNPLYPLFLRDKIQIALEIINNNIGKGKIPSGIKEQFLKEIINQGVCICGRHFEPNSECYDILINLLHESLPSTFEDAILNLRGDAAAISRITSVNYENLIEKTKRHSELGEQIEQLDRKKDELSRKIGNHEDVNLAGLEQRRIEFSRNIKLLNQRIGQCESKIEYSQNEMKSIIKLREIEEQKQSELKNLSMREKLAREATEAITKIKEQFYEETRKRIECETKKVFESLAWKTDQFNQIRLDQEFHLEVIDRWNMPAREELSAGERQILSLAFIAAMARLSGEDAPVIMDTPFARLSGEHLQNVSRNLPDLVPQLIVFVTDSEWNVASRSGLEPRIGAEYNLNFVDGITSIEEVPFG